MGETGGKGGSEQGSQREPARGLGASRGEDWVRGQRERGQDEEAADGGGEGERQVGRASRTAAASLSWKLSL